MLKIKERVGPRGLHIPKALLEESGFSEGTSVIIEPAAGTLRVVPEEVDAATIRKASLRYLLHGVGDAVDVGVPRRVGETWQVDVTVPHRQACIGVLTYTGSGMLLPEASTNPDDMLRKAHEA